MKFKSFISIGILTGATLFAASASAEGWYVGADVGRSSTGNILPTMAMTKSTDTVGGVFAGYQFTQNWGVEGFYTQGGKFSAIGGGAYADGKTKDIYGLDLVGTLPLADAFSVYGRVGYANTKTSVSSVPAGVTGTNRSAATYGLGGEYDITPQVGLRLGWDRYGASVSSVGFTNNFNVHVWSLGILYKF